MPDLFLNARKGKERRETSRGKAVGGRREEKDTEGGKKWMKRGEKQRKRKAERGKEWREKGRKKQIGTAL